LTLCNTTVPIFTVYSTVSTATISTDNPSTYTFLYKQYPKRYTRKPPT
jgi:hypothetical protein